MRLSRSSRLEEYPKWASRDEKRTFPMSAEALRTVVASASPKSMSLTAWELGTVMMFSGEDRSVFEAAYADDVAE
ncbi:unnamed protein product [Sphagnum balticum]